MKRRTRLSELESSKTHKKNMKNRGLRRMVCRDSGIALLIYIQIPEGLM